MLEASSGCRLESESLACNFACDPQSREDLECDLDAVRLTHGLEHDPHAAAAELTQDPEFTEPLGRG